jgi:hypothetical protein
MDEDSRKKIDVLLKEYEMLRSEILTRSTQQFTLMTITGVTAAWLLSQPLRFATWCIIAVVGGIFANLFWILQIVIWRAGSRAKEIEGKINSFAGESLLEWETKWGGIAQGSYRKRPRTNLKISN